MTSLLLAILAHANADFVMQSEQVVKAKEALKITGFIKHGVTILLSLLVFLHGYKLPSLLIFIAAVTSSHLLLDYLKSLFKRLTAKRLDFSWFLWDQFLHLVIIIVFWQVFTLQANLRIGTFYQSLFTEQTLAVWQREFISHTLVSPMRLLIAVLIYTYTVFGGAVFIRKFLELIAKTASSTMPNGPEYSRTGTYIGILERFLTVTLVINGALPAVAFIFTAKSIARFSELNNREFAEYYLIGTFLSTTLAVIGGYILNFLFTFID